MLFNGYWRFLLTRPLQCAKLNCEGSHFAIMVMN